MKSTSHLVTVVSAALALTWGLNQARASLTTFTIDNGGLESFNLNWDGNPENGALAGGILLTHVSGSIPTLSSVCTDIGGTVYLGQSYIYSEPTVFNNQDGIRPSWGAGNQGIPLDTPWASLTAGQKANASAAINAAADVFYHHQDVLMTGSIIERAALQLAVWEALYDTTAGSTAYSLAAGRFSVSSGDATARSTAADWLSKVNASAEYAGYLLIPSPESQHGLNAQEMLYNVTPVPEPTSNVTPVPEPTTLVAGALLLVPFGVSTLKFVRKNRAL